MRTRAALLSCFAVSACGPGLELEGEDPVEELEAPFESDVATLLDLEYDGELVTTVASAYSPAIRAQTFYAVGLFNGEGGVARLNRLSLSSIRSTALGGGLARVRYHAKLPVAWPSKTDLPTSYELILPRRADQAGQQEFLGKYRASCGDYGGAEATLANYWYHYRPRAAGCALEPGDVVRATASATPSRENVPAQYPELHKVWEDGALRIVAVFGKYQADATTDADAGVRAFHLFVDAAREFLDGPRSTPETIDASTTDVTFETSFADGRDVSLVILLVDELKSEGPAFDERYDTLSTMADAVLYSGHAGLGSNIASLTRKGEFLPERYQFFFMNGCDTFAYSDETLRRGRAALNPVSDPSGTLLLDLAYNAMPAYFNDMPDASIAMIRMLLERDTPRTFTAAFREVDPVQVVVGIGTEDNVFRPRAPFTPVGQKLVLREEGAVGYAELNTHSLTLDAGRYAFQLQHAPSAQAGDADLRMKVGTGAVQRCVSRFRNTNEYCELTLSSRKTVTLTVTGDARATSSAYELRGFRR